MKSVILLLLFPCLASGQTLVGDRVRLNAGSCTITSQAGPPVRLVLSGTCDGLTTSAATNLTLAPTGDLVTDPAGKDILPNLPYDINIGMLSKKYLTLHAAELWVETLVAQNTIATIGGRVLVAPTNILTVDLAPASTTISVKYNNFINGDRVYMEADGKLEFMAVASGASGGGPYTYTVTRNLDGTGANQWYAGDALLDTGTTGDGFIDLYSTAGILSSGSGPTIVGNVRTGTTYNAYAPRWAIGNLNGLYGYGATTYGAAFGDASATNVTVDATNGFRIRNSTTNKFVADTSGNLSIVGDLSVGTAGVIRSGATSLTTGTGYWLAYNGGTPQFRVGNPGGGQFVWDGTTLTAAGWVIGATSITDAAAVVGLSSAVTGGDDIRIWAGNATPGSAAFRVTESGALVASSATVTGSVTASSGAIGACTISSTTLVCGGVTLDGNGITLTAASGATNTLKFTDSTNLSSISGATTLSATGSITLSGGGYGMSISGSGVIPFSGVALGGSGANDRWNSLFLTNDLNWVSPPDTDSNDYPMVYSVGNTKIYRKTDGYDGTCTLPTSIVIERGIVVGCS